MAAEKVTHIRASVAGRFTRSAELAECGAKERDGAKFTAQKRATCPVCSARFIKRHRLGAVRAAAERLP